MEAKNRIPEVRAEVIMETVEGICYKSHDGVDYSEAAQYIGKGIAYARRALDASLQLGLTEEKESRFFAVKDATDISRANREQWPVIFRIFLQRYSPFILFVMLIGKNNSIEDAARKTKVIYNIEASIDIISSTLLGWGEYSKILKKDRKKVTLQIETEKLSAEYIRELLEAMEHDMKARVYIASKLGENVFGYMKDDELDFLVKGIREHQTDPRDAIDDAGRAFEDFLRRIGTDRSIPVTEKKGIQQLADALRSGTLIDIKHLELCKAINSLRIAASHSKDRNSLERWILNKDASIECILLTLTTIRSIHHYVFKQIQMF